MAIRKLLASMGIGNAKVDTVLNHDELYPGTQVEGEVRIQGGDVAQDIDRISFDLVTVAQDESRDGEPHDHALIARIAISEAMTVDAGAFVAIPFSFTLPIDTPINSIDGHDLPIPIELHTSLDIAAAIDPRDRDPIRVSPNALQERILKAMDELGFRLFKSDLEFGHIPGQRLPFYQEIEFYPPPSLSRYMSELELTFVCRDGSMDVVLEMDKKTRGLARLAYSSVDEIRGFTIDYNDDWEQEDWESVIELHLR
ncbi:sporulation protein [Pseudobacteriovorax antillogorgiicola]|uniref:Sporulation-control protein n=1 Tax=Pseudobacteriovorax antillogorgiicola TaxID=1513793 RepID=A0A1Y6CRL2_9BACT|nr:sporulation protein [Pseudobacteriovorax antillogorgiicola]TCS41802.1 sporulation-control protein [Pseudobacteriovorax antillogorgiicola]SMF83463.1 sporulation-control protein [Pseudobacteriovorax antillogorgiicola]